MGMFCRVTVLSIIDYGSPIYGSTSEAALKLSDPLHTQGLRLCTGAFQSSPNRSLLTECGEPPLSLHLDLVMMSGALNICNSDSPTKQLFTERGTFAGRNHPPYFQKRANQPIVSTALNILFTPNTDLPPPWTIQISRICT